MNPSVTPWKSPRLEIPPCALLVSCGYGPSLTAWVMKKPKPKKPQGKNVSWTTGRRALIRIDQEPIRKKALSEFKRINKILLKERQELSHHFNVVRPPTVIGFPASPGRKYKGSQSLRISSETERSCSVELNSWSMKTLYLLGMRMSMRIRNMKRQEIRRTKEICLSMSRIRIQMRTRNFIKTKIQIKGSLSMRRVFLTSYLKIWHRLWKGI